MSPRSSSAYFISVLLHATVIALILFLAYAATENTVDAPKVFELVAGAGNNYAATEAPALGSPDGSPTDTQPPVSAVSVAPLPPVPTPPAPPEEVIPAQETPPAALAPLPDTATAPAPAKAKAKARTDAQKLPNFAKNLKRIEAKRASRLIARYKKQMEAERLREERMSYDEYRREHPGGKGIAGGVVGGSRSNTKGGAGGRALTREEGDLLDAYFAELKLKIHDNLIPPPEASDKLEAVVEFYLAADGSLSHPHVVNSSGNREFDRSVVEAFMQTRSIGPRPDGKGETVRMTLRLREEE